MAKGTKGSAAIGFKNWETPQNYFDQLNDEFGFTLDAAASVRNALLPHFCTESKVWWRGEGIAQCYGVAGGGLGWNWANERVFCNPPYDNSIGQWVEKALKREAEVAVLLLPPSVDTAWFQKLHSQILRGAEPLTKSYGKKTWRGIGDSRLELLFMEGRLRFWKDGKPGDAPRAGNLLVVVRR